MWSLLGDLSAGPPGTYYYTRPEQNVFFWNMFDQVLIRPALLDAFQPETLAVIEGDGEVSFLSKRGIPRKDFSDHLPLVFSLRL